MRNNKRYSTINNKFLRKDNLRDNNKESVVLDPNMFINQKNLFEEKNKINELNSEEDKYVNDKSKDENINNNKYKNKDNDKDNNKSQISNKSFPSIKSIDSNPSDSSDDNNEKDIIKKVNDVNIKRENLDNLDKYQLTNIKEKAVNPENTKTIGKNSILSNNSKLIMLNNGVQLNKERTYSESNNSEFIYDRRDKKNKAIFFTKKKRQSEVARDIENNYGVKTSK